MKKIFLAIAIAVSSLSMMAQAGSDKSVQDSCCNVNNIENCNPGQACANPQNCNQANCNANECAACPGPQNCDNQIIVVFPAIGLTIKGNAISETNLKALA